MNPDELRKRMVANGIPSGNQLATKLGVNQATVSRWLTADDDKRTTITIGMAALIRQKLPKTK